MLICYYPNGLCARLAPPHPPAESASDGQPSLAQTLDDVVASRGAVGGLLLATIALLA
jgi:hypothetical protein